MKFFDLIADLTILALLFTGVSVVMWFMVNGCS